MQDKDNKIHLINQRDLSVVSTILADSFKADPVLNWFIQDPAIFVYLFRSLIESLKKQQQCEHVYINTQQTGVAVWLPPGVATRFSLHRSLIIFLKRLLKTNGLNGVKRGMSLNRLTAKYHIKEPHFYLYLIGVKSDRQGMGIGAELLDAGLQVCDELGVPAYLESSNSKNNPLYERYGFKIIQEIQLPDNGPKLYCMKRAARN